MTAVHTQPDLSTKKEAIAALKDAVTNVFLKDLDQPIETKRIEQVVLAERNYLYYQGKQYLVPMTDVESRSLGWRQAGSRRMTGPRKNPRFSSVYNVIYSDGIKYQSVIGQRPQNVKCVSDDSSSELLKSQAKFADLAARHLHLKWDMRAVAKMAAFHQWVTGPSFWRPFYNADGVKYGYDLEPTFDSEDITEPAGFRCPVCQEKHPVMDCPNCRFPMDGSHFEPSATISLPVEGEPIKYARGEVELEMHSVFYVTTPFAARDIDECDWLAYKKMEPLWRLRDKYGARGAELFETGGTPNNSADLTVLSAKQAIEAPTGVGLEDFSMFRVDEERWIVPSVYHAFPSHIGKALKKQFPDGVRLARVGDQLLDVNGAKLAEDWDVCKTGTGEYITSSPLSHYIIPIQDDLNNFINMAKETILRGIPRTLVNSQLIDRDAWEEKAGIIGELITVKATAGENLSNQLFQLPTAKFSEQLMPLVSYCENLRRDIDGMQPVLFGGGEGFATWRQSAQAKNMALMQLEPSSSEIQRCVARSTKKGVGKLVAYGGGKITLPADKDNAFSEPESFEVSQIKMDGWHCEPVEALPFSFAEKIQVFEEMVKENPALAMTLGVQSPMNIGEIQQMYGLQNLYAPGGNELKACNARIVKLLGEQATDDIDPMDGKPIRKSSVPVMMFEDKNHQLFAEVIRTWCNSDAGRRAHDKNPAGYENVALHGQEQDQQVMLQGAQQAGAPGPGGPPAPPPGKAKPDAPQGPTGPIPPVGGEKEPNG